MLVVLKSYKYFGSSNEKQSIRMVATMDELKGFHEVFSERERINAGSDRAFGIVFALLFLIIGGFPILYGSDLRFWALGIGSVFFGVAIIAPQILRPLNIIWFKFKIDRGL